MKNIEIGTVVVYSIGFGCNTFYQVIAATPKTITVRKLKQNTTINVPMQSYKGTPIKDDFDDEDGDDNIITLKVNEDGRIGPLKRMCWWNIWYGEPVNNFSP